MEKGIKDSIKKIVLIGPESTGKTELAQFLSSKFNTVFVPEYAREYISNLGRRYNYKDVEIIAKKQIELEQDYLRKSERGILFYDTYLIITKVWFKVVYNFIPKWLETEIGKSKIGLFLLCNTDIPWEPDLVRENGGEMREKLFEMYKKELLDYGFNFEIVKGTAENRYNNALDIVNKYLK